MRNVTITVTNFNSSAYDLDQVYGYNYNPASYSGTNLYTLAPTTSQMTLLLSNGPNPKTSNTSFQVPIGNSVGFALANTTGGVIAYGETCYGQQTGQQYLYYSHRWVSGSYYDYPQPNQTKVASFVACQDTLDTSATFTVCTPTTTKANGKSTTNGKYGTVASGSTCWETNAGNWSKGVSESTVPAASSYIYSSSYGRNPLQFSTTNTDCTKGDVGYRWDDNGGGDDDNDFNDADFTVNCTELVLANQTIKLTN
jgi:hypothetical protein